MYKSFIATILIIFFSIACAWSMSPFFENDKTWVRKDYDPYMPDNGVFVYKYSVEKDTIVDNVTAKKIHIERLDNDERNSFREGFAIYYEENDCIFIVSEEDSFVKLMDFSVNVGDRVREDLIVTKTETINIKGVNRCVITIQRDSNPNDITYWIEGIGATKDNYMNAFESPVGRIDELVNCYLGDKCLYSEEDLNKLNEIENVITDTDESETLFDLNGQRIRHPQKGKIYIRGEEKVLW